MKSLNSVNDSFVFIVTLRELRAQEYRRGIRILLLDLADFMQQTCALGCLNLGVELSGHVARHDGDLTAVLRYERSRGEQYGD